MKQTWLFKIVECVTERRSHESDWDMGLFIGVYDYEKEKNIPDSIRQWVTDRGWIGHSKSNAHGYWSIGDQYRGIKELLPRAADIETCKWGKDDIIEMTLDLRKDDGVMYFKVNGIQQKVLSDKMNVNKIWCVVIAMPYKGEIEYIAP